MNIDKTALLHKTLTVASTLGITISAPYVAPFVIPFLAPLVVDSLNAVGKELLLNITANALWEMKDSFQPTHENQDLSRLLAKAYSQAIHHLLQEVEVNDGYEEYREMARVTLPCIKERIERALKIGTEEELIKLFPTREYFENKLTSAQEPQKAPFYLRWFGYTKSPEAPVDEKFANQASAEDFILSIAEDSATAKQLIADEIEISLRRWFKEENPTIEKFPDWSLAPFVFDKLAEIIPKELGELVKTGKLERSWIAFQRAHLQAILKEVKTNKGLSDEDRELLTPLAEKLDSLANSDFPRQLADSTSGILLRLAESEENIKRSVSDESLKLQRYLQEILEEVRADKDLKPFLRVFKPDDSKEGLGRFSYVNSQDNFAGRADLVERLFDGFLAVPGSQSPKFQYCYATGQAGVGKSRLALELVNRVEETWPHGSLTGFVARGDMKAAIERLHSKDWKPSQPTFIVIDYAVEAFAHISQLLTSLARRREGFRHPLRILLLARSSEHDLMENLIPKDSEGASVKECQLDEIKLKGLDSESCVAIMRGRIRKGGGNEKNFSDKELDDILESIDENRRPLWAAMVGELVGLNAEFLSADTKLKGYELRQKAIQWILERERQIWRKRESSLDGQNQKTLRRKHEMLLALATMTRGLLLKHVRSLGDSYAHLLPVEREEFNREFYAVISDDKDDEKDDKKDDKKPKPPQGERRLRPLEPDVLGEGFVDLIFKKQWFFDLEGEALLELAWHLKPFDMAIFVVLFEGDFGPSLESPLRFLPKVPPREDSERIAISHALAGISYARVMHLFEREKWSNPLPGDIRFTPDKFRVEVIEGVEKVKKAVEQRILSNVFETKSGKPLPEE